VPLDFGADPSSALNIDWIEAHSVGWPDKELLGFLRDGINFRAKLPLAFLFSPHLTSLRDGVASVEKELRRLDVAGYHTVHSALPFAPTRFMSQGSTSRKLEPDRKRRTTDGGCPRDVVFDEDGNQCVSINEAIGLKSTTAEAAAYDAARGHVPDDSSGAVGDAASMKWKQAEIKPRVEDKMYDDTVLRAAARQAFHQHLYGFSDDFKDYYQQMALAGSQRWVSGLVWQQLNEVERVASGGGVPAYIAEQRLGFDISLSSNLGQRLAELILSVFRTEFDREENALFDTILPVGGACVSDGVIDAATRTASGYTDVCRWIARRRTLAKVTGNSELRAYAVHQYTDDAVFTCIGAERTVRALRCWHRVTTGFGMPMAIDAKRQVGTRLLWLGMEWHVSLGLLVMQQDKVQRAALALDLIIGGVELTTFDTYRSLMGLFEHLLAFSEGDRTLMDHLYSNNFRRGNTYGPLTIMVFGDQQLNSLRRWRRLLMRATGCTCSVALRLASVVRPRLPERLRASTLFTPQPRVPGAFFLYSDAASDDCGGGGLGGWVHGGWWYFKLTSEDKDMFHITVLELIAAGINVVLYGDLLGGCDVTLCVDALSSAQLIAAGHSHSEAMAVVWGVIQETSQYAALKPLLREAHVYGETNVMSDASSREKFQVIRDVAEQCGVAATRIPLPERALDFVNAVRVATRHLRAEQLHMARVGAHYDEQRPGPLPAREPSAEELAHMQSRERQRSDNEDSDAVLGSGNGAAQDDEAGKPLGARADEAAQGVRSGGASQAERAAALPGTAAANVVRGESARLGAPAIFREPAASGAVRGVETPFCSSTPDAPRDGGARLAPRAEASGLERGVGDDASGGGSSGGSGGGVHAAAWPAVRAPNGEELAHMQARERQRSDNEDGDAVPPALQAFGQWAMPQPSGSLGDRNKRAAEAEPPNAWAKGGPAVVLRPRGAQSFTELWARGAATRGVGALDTWAHLGQSAPSTKIGWARTQPVIASQDKAAAWESPLSSTASSTWGRAGAAVRIVGPLDKKPWARKAAHSGASRSLLGSAQTALSLTPALQASHRDESEARKLATSAWPDLRGAQRGTLGVPWQASHRDESVARELATSAWPDLRGAQRGTLGVPWETEVRSHSCGPQTSVWQPPLAATPLSPGSQLCWGSPRSKAPPLSWGSPRSKAPPLSWGSPCSKAPVHCASNIAPAPSPIKRARGSGEQTTWGVLQDPSAAPQRGLYDRLLADTSPYALRPADPSLLFKYSQALSHALERAPRPGTRKTDACAWRHWTDFTALMGTPTLRRDEFAEAWREMAMVGAFILYLMGVLVPKVPGRVFCKPDSYMAHAYGIQRVHKRHGVRFDVLFMAKQVLKTLSDEYCRRHGPECLIPERKEPLSRAMYRRMLSVPSGLRISVRGSPTLLWGSWFGRSYAAMMGVCASGGFRKAEVSLASGVTFDPMHLSRAHLFWVIGGTILRASGDVRR
jgi:hypothetical protein